MTARRSRSLLLAGAALSVAMTTTTALVVRADGPPAGAESAKPQAAKPAATTAGKSATKPAATKPAATATTRSAKEMSSEEMMSQLLKPREQTGTKPLAPLPSVSSGGPDKTSGPGAVAPAAPVVSVLREGTFLVDRVGRLVRSADGSQAEFAFESDGTAMQDPPLVVVPNLKLMQMEDATANNTSMRALRFRVSGVLTEYRGRNYILLEKVVVIPEILEKF